MKYDIISIGSATRDVLLGVQGNLHDNQLVFPLGSKIEITKIVTTSGGGGTNAAVTFARQGLSTAYIGVVGNDFNGHEILNELKKEAVDAQYVALHDDDHTAYSAILVHGSGERTILSYKGEGQHFAVSMIPFNDLEAEWLFLDSLGGHYDVLQAAVNWAVKKKMKLAANPGGKELAHGLEKLAPLYKFFSIVSMNLEEAGALTGKTDELEVLKAMKDIVGGIFILTKGGEGVLVSDGINIFRAGIPDAPIVERTGAGDAFVSAFIAEYTRSKDISKAIQLATANASSVVAQWGAKAGILKKDDMGPWPLVEVTTQ
jgi:ribokinase